MGLLRGLVPEFSGHSCTHAPISQGVFSSPPLRGCVISPSVRVIILWPPRGINLWTQRVVFGGGCSCISTTGKWRDYLGRSVATCPGNLASFGLGSSTTPSDRACFRFFFRKNTCILPVYAGPVKSRWSFASSNKNTFHTVRALQPGLQLEVYPLSTATTPSSQFARHFKLG